MSMSTLVNDHPLVETDNDETLVRAAQRHPDGFKPLYHKWLKPVYRYFFLHTASEKDAEDLTSLVFLKVYEDLPHYHSRGCFSAWLFSISHARLVDYYRRKRPVVNIDQLEAPTTSADLLSTAVQNDDLRRLLLMVSGLPEDDQELIRLRFAAGLNYREIGLVVNRSEDAVRKSLTRLITRLQKNMEVNHE